MIRTQTTAATPSTAPRRRRKGGLVAGLIFGVPLAAGILYLVHGPVLMSTPAAPYVEHLQRYLKHPVEGAEVVMFCVAISALAMKLWRSMYEKVACRARLLPEWNGKLVPASEAGKLLAHLNELPRLLRNSWLGTRMAEVLDFVCSRRSANELDDHLRTLADNDAIALEGSYSLTKFITWAIPILGFLGTVLGITESIAGVTPQTLENDLNSVTSGLSLAFDCTAVGLALTMVTMFFSFIVERTEQGVLETVDATVERQLAHRFERAGAEAGEFVGIVRQSSELLLKATEQLVQRQAELWSQTFTEASKRLGEAESRQQDRLTDAMEAALNRSLEAHSQRLAALEQEIFGRSSGLMEQIALLSTAVRDTGRGQQSALAQNAQAMAAQAEALYRLHEGSKQLAQIQETLNQNLATLAGTGAFEEAMQSLTAAIHLLTARAGALPINAASTRPAQRPGAAA